MTLSSLLEIVYVAMPLTCWLLNALVLRRRIHGLLLFILACVAGYIVLMVSVQAVEVELERELYRHDIDGDGVFSGKELTPEAERAMDAVTSDTGRTFAPITGIPITFIWTAVNFAVIFVIEWIVRLIFHSLRRRNASN